MFNISQLEQYNSSQKWLILALNKTKKWTSQNQPNNQ